MVKNFGPEEYYLLLNYLTSNQKWIDLIFKEGCKGSAAMLKRLITIFSCICMVGVTVLPASAVPCCCRQAGKPNCCEEHQAKALPGCCHEAREQTLADECCRSSVDQTNIDQKCPRCRCLEEMQIVTLSGYQAYTVPERPNFSALTGEVPGLIAEAGVCGRLINQPIPCARFPLSVDTCVLRF
jgi:hypothetical protein